MAFSRHITDGKIAVKKKSDVPTPPPSCCFTCLARITRKLKRKGRRLLLGLTARSRRQVMNSLQCRYDPMSYSLNFDGGAYGTLPDDEDYYFRFYAFSSRYVTTNSIKKRPPFPRETLSATSHQFV